MPVSAISNRITDLDNSPLAGVTVTVRLKPDVPHYRISDSSEVAQSERTVTDATGFWSLELERNSNLTPGGSWYEATEDLPVRAGGNRTTPLLVGNANSTLMGARIIEPPAGPVIGTVLTQELADGRYVKGIMTLLSQPSPPLAPEQGDLWVAEEATGPSETFEASGSVNIHAAASDPHPGYRLESVLISAADVAADIATQAELDTHAAAADPHAGYRLESVLLSNSDISASAAIAEAKLNLASDAPAATPSRRTLGTGALQAAAGNDNRLFDSRTPLAHKATHEVGGSDPFTGIVPGSAFAPAGITGVAQASRYVGATAGGKPTSGSFVVGDFIIDRAGYIWICTVAGTPGTWVSPSGGTLGYAEVTAGQTGITTETDLTGLSVGGTIGTNRRIRVSLSLTADRTAADGTTEVYIKEGTTTLQHAGYQVVINSQGVAIVQYVVLTPSAGSHTYKLTMRQVTGTGTSGTVATVNMPASILVEDIGGV